MSDMRDFTPLFANQTCVTLEQLTDFFNKNSTISGRFGGLNYISTNREITLTEIFTSKQT